jgi:hypothetical protein
VVEPGGIPQGRSPSPRKAESFLRYPAHFNIAPWSMNFAVGSYHPSLSPVITSSFSSITFQLMCWAVMFANVQAPDIGAFIAR